METSTAQLSMKTPRSAFFSFFVYGREASSEGSNVDQGLACVCFVQGLHCWCWPRQRKKETYGGGGHMIFFGLDFFPPLLRGPPTTLIISCPRNFGEHFFFRGKFILRLLGSG